MTKTAKNHTFEQKLKRKIMISQIYDKMPVNTDVSLST